MSSSNPLLSCGTTFPPNHHLKRHLPLLYVGGGMPPIPAKLAKRIQEGLFVEMVKLMPDYLSGPNPFDENQLKSSKFKNWEIINIVD